MGNIYSSFDMIHFEDIHKDENSLLINTLPMSEQQVLIDKTINAQIECETINDLIKKKKYDKKIIIYGKNYRDKTIIKKFNQLKKMGFKNIYIYFGGLFEWVLLQDIFSEEHFKTTSKINDILKYK